MTTLAVDVKASLDGFTLDVAMRASGPTAVIGPNGAGKTTLLLLVLGILRPSAGRIALGERILFDVSRGRDVPTELRRLGYVPQSYGLFPHMNVLDNVAFAVCDLGRGGKAARRHRAMAVLETLEVDHLADRRPRELSGGEAQRVALARALAADPHALLLDEPLAALDPGVRERTRRLLGDRLRRLGIPSIVVTHDAADARALADGVVVLEAGKVVQAGSTDAVSASPATPFAQAFFGTGSGRSPTDEIDVARSPIRE